MNPKKYRVSAETLVEDTDLDLAPITLPSGTVLDEEAAEKLGREVADSVARKRGRPSLTGRKQSSPQVSSRVTPEVRKALDAIAEREGVRPAEVVRRAVVEYVEHHG